MPKIATGRIAHFPGHRPSPRHRPSPATAHPRPPSFPPPPLFLGYPNGGLTTVAGSPTPWTGDQTGLHATYAEEGDGSTATCNGDLRYLLSGHHSSLSASVASATSSVERGPIRE